MFYVSHRARILPTSRSTSKDVADLACHPAFLSASRSASHSASHSGPLSAFLRHTSPPLPTPPPKVTVASLAPTLA
jgi:hypothetical protein